MVQAKKIFSTGIFVSCLFCCLAQIYQIINLYLKYETVTLLTISRPEKVHPPLVYVCIFIGHFLKEFVGDNFEANKYNFSTKRFFEESPNLNSSFIVRTIILVIN